jgi:predicted site-specific integrase-resolvase
MVTMARITDTIAAELATGIKPATLRQWIHRGKITSHGTDHAGRILVDLDEIGRVTDKRRTCGSRQLVSH